MGLRRTNFTAESMQTQMLNDIEESEVFNPDMSFYPQNEKGEYSKEALFMSFLKTDCRILAGGNTKINLIALAYEKAMDKESFSTDWASLDDIMTNKVDFASLLRAKASEGWFDADIYAYENGIKRQNNYLGYGGAWFDRQFDTARANGWKPSSPSIDDFVGSIMDRLYTLINQSRV